VPRTSPVPIHDTLTDRRSEPGPRGDQALLRSLIVFACLMEACSSTSGSPRSWEGRQNKMPGAPSSNQYILPPPAMHCQLRHRSDQPDTLENPHMWTAAVRGIRTVSARAVELRNTAHAEERCPREYSG